GYAVFAADTAGAGESMPVLLDIAEKLCAGSVPACAVGSGKCAYTPTGGMIPEGADAVVPVELCQNVSDSRVAIFGAVSAGVMSCFRARMWERDP
ncbi:MAG: molybdopterin molybdenumtransferase MoeA, partial [Clostridia bacterium]|nr:molybdopterin molybdenumtransferase MoeA [Clostridia bacterium]